MSATTTRDQSQQSGQERFREVLFRRRSSMLGAVVCLSGFGVRAALRSPHPLSPEPARRFPVAPTPAPTTTSGVPCALGWSARWPSAGWSRRHRLLSSRAAGLRPARRASCQPLRGVVPSLSGRVSARSEQRCAAGCHARRGVARAASAVALLPRTGLGAGHALRRCCYRERAYPSYRRRRAYQRTSGASRYFGHDSLHVRSSGSRPPEPNHALQRTEAGGRSVSVCHVSLASLRR